jgi:hypothetical protein
MRCGPQLPALDGRKLQKMKARKVAVEERLEDLLTISDSLHRTQGRRAHRDWTPGPNGTQSGMPAPFLAP